MKRIVKTNAIAFLMLFATANAEAVVCANGVYRAGCAGPRGAVIARKPVVVAPRPVVVVPPRPVVVVPARHCYYVNRVRVCR
jgi:hypothetical protein